jgi:hypothetical protein
MVTVERRNGQRELDSTRRRGGRRRSLCAATFACGNGHLNAPEARPAAPEAHPVAALPDDLVLGVVPARLTQSPGEPNRARVGPWVTLRGDRLRPPA